MIDLDDRAGGIVPILLLTAAKRKDVIERQSHLVLPKRQHAIEIVREKTNVDLLLCELHGESFQ
jgi:hypothetical protein